MLHGIYVHLSSSSSNPQDLSMNLADIKLGLKHAAGFRTLQESLQEGFGGNLGSGNLAGHPASGQPRKQHRFEAATQSSRGRNVDLGSIGAKQQNRHLQDAPCGSNPVNGGKTFHLPLYKVAAFLRAAKLLPQLLEKYITQLQRLGEDQKERVETRGWPIMPVLRANASAAHAGGFKVAQQSGQKRR